MINEDELTSFVMVGRRKYPIRIASVKLISGMMFPTDPPLLPYDITFKSSRLPDFEIVYRLKSHQRVKIPLNEVMKSDQVVKVIIERIKEHLEEQKNNKKED